MTAPPLIGGPSGEAGIEPDELLIAG